MQYGCGVCGDRRVPTHDTTEDGVKLCVSCAPYVCLQCGEETVTPYGDCTVCMEGTFAHPTDSLFDTVDDEYWD